MFKYIFILLLINYYNCGLGSVIKKHLGTMPLGKELMELAQRCENKFLSDQITSKVKECNILATPDKEAPLIEFTCMLFLDINEQLCSAIKPGHTGLELEFVPDEPMNVTTVCASASKWNISELKNFPMYKEYGNKIFNNTMLCSKLCVDEGVLSTSANYFCKYYRWGKNVLEEQSKAYLDIVVKQEAPETLADVNITSAEANITAKNIEKTDEAIVKAPDVLAPKEILTNEHKLANNTAMVISSTTNSTSNGQLLQPEQTSSLVEKSVLNEDKINTDVHNDLPEAIPIDDGQSGGLQAPLEPVDNEKSSNKPSSVQQSEQKPPVLDNPKIDQDYPGSDIDSEEGKDDPDDLADANIGDNNNINNNEQTIQTQSSIRKVPVSTLSREINQKDIFTSTLQEGFSDDNNDHFFSFFLTAVILVIFVYVLYHNKSKVSKVVLGLLVEGRQPGRRRNSRGHSYRRLDTLEQAMSSSSASAPPSKMIY